MNTIFPFQPMIITKVNAHSLSRPVDAIENKQKSTACLVLTGCQQAPIFDQPVKRKSQLLSGPILGGAYICNSKELRAFHGLKKPGLKE
ncbi:MAG: hypothetical protein ACMVP2_11195 [Imperialibacter sp.]|uniref:hypothetical protein n=1 Tax=Imperialibacter sp. TaxID=2038411 RepID=UPI003A883F36